MTAYPIPDAALANHIAILGKTGSGKSNAAKTLVEAALDRKERVCIIDPTGTWYGLRLNRKGKPSPYPVVIFGGRHADVQIGEAHGAAIAETVGTSSTPAIIDTRLMTVGARTRFFTDFAEALLRTNVGQLTLVIDEAHVFMPQGKVSDPRSGMMLHAGNNLVSLGRGLGLRIVLISQRPAKLHKDSLTQVETLVAMRLIAPQDRAAINDWIKECAEPEKGKEIIASLPSLPTGDAWVWAPEIGVLHREHFPLAGTFDTGKPPAAGETGPALSPLNIAEVTERLAKVAADVVANDPKTLKAEIARLQKEVAAKPAPPTVSAPDPQALIAARQEGYEAGLQEGFNDAHIAGQADMLERAKSTVTALGVRLDFAAPQPSKKAQPPSPRPAPAPPPRPATPTTPKPAPASPAPSGEAVGALTGPQNHLLTAIAWWKAMGHDRPTRTQVAAIAEWKPTGSNLRNRLSELSSLGLVDYPGTGLVRLTDAGQAAAPEPDRSRTLLDSIRAVLTGPQAALFEALLDDGAEMSRAMLAEKVGWEPGGSNLRNRLSELSSLELVEYPAKGTVALQEWVTQ